MSVCSDGKARASETYANRKKNEIHFIVNSTFFVAQLFGIQSVTNENAHVSAA